MDRQLVNLKSFIFCYKFWYVLKDKMGRKKATKRAQKQRQANLRTINPVGNSLLGSVREEARQTRSQARAMRDLLGEASQNQAGPQNQTSESVATTSGGNSGRRVQKQ